MGSEVIAEQTFRAKATCLVTRNPGDFPKSVLPILTPEEFLGTLHSRK